jgi:ubiquinone/menaquinone biosynthesis C-methylase UbiE
MNAAATASPARNVEHWTGLHAEGYFATHPRYKERVHTLGLERIVALLSPRADDVLLEIGCGYGRLMWHLLPFVRGGRIIGVELAEEPFAEARQLLKDRGEFDLIRNDGLTLRAIPDQSITGAYAFTVLQHMTRAGARGYIREAARVLVPGGRVCLQFLCDGTTERDILDEQREQSISYSAAQVCDTIERAGLRVERLDRECLDATYPGSGLSWLWVLASKPAGNQTS